MVASCQESYDKPRQCVKKQRHHSANKDLYSQGYGLFSSHVGMWELDNEEGWAPKNWCFQTVVLEKALENPLDRKIKPVNSGKSTPKTLWKDWCWSLSSCSLATWCKQLTHWKRPWSWERLKAEGEVGDRGWDDWMALPIQWTWTWTNSRRWWGLGKPGRLQSMGLQRVGHDLAFEQKQNQDNSFTSTLHCPDCFSVSFLPNFSWHCARDRWKGRLWRAA